MINNRCISCKNYLGDLSCMAFSKIPKSILLDKEKHLKPLKDQDNNIVFEPIKIK